MHYLWLKVSFLYCWAAYWLTVSMQYAWKTLNIKRARAVDLLWKWWLEFSVINCNFSALFWLFPFITLLQVSSSMCPRTHPGRALPAVKEIAQLKTCCFPVQHMLVRSIPGCVWYNGEGDHYIISSDCGIETLWLFELVLSSMHICLLVF